MIKRGMKGQLRAYNGSLRNKRRHDRHVVESLDIGSAQGGGWIRMPALRLTIGPSLIPHVIVLDPSMPG